MSGGERGVPTPPDEQPPNKPPATANTDSDTHLAGVLRTITADDLKNIQQCYWVRQDAIDWSHMRVSTGSAHIEFVFRLTNASVWTTTLTNKVDGLLKYFLGSEHFGPLGCVRRENRDKYGLKGSRGTLLIEDSTRKEPRPVPRDAMMAY